MPAPKTPRAAIQLADFSVDPQRGFLPSADPLRQLPPAFDPWEKIARELPKLLAADRLRSVLDGLPVLDPARLAGDGQLERAMLLFSYFGHGYVWGGAGPAKRLPEGIAVPWHQVAERLGRPPVLSYASYALHNWRRLDPGGPIALGNIVLLQNFLGGVDEEWFILVHVDIEARAARALKAIGAAQAAVLAEKPAALLRHLRAVAAAAEDMYRTLRRMPERCDPYVYFNRVRPYIYGWEDHPALPDGIVYEGVAAYSGKPQKFRGETGAQSGIIPCLDAFLGVGHKDDPLRRYLIELRDYMPPKHRAFLEAVEAGPSIRSFVHGHRQAHPRLREAYNACVEEVHGFRSRHLEYAGRYIQLQAQRDASNPTDVGTGGTPFIRYLRKHREETAEHLIE